MKHSDAQDKERLPILDICGVTLRFGGLTAVNNVSLSVHEGEIFSLIGPNGAGKTSVFNAVTGIYKPTAGTVLLRGSNTALRFSYETAACIGLIALITGFLVVTTINIQALWDESIIGNYIYRQPFPWGKASGDFFKKLADTPFAWSVLPLLISSFIGAYGAYSVWHRAKRSPDVVNQFGIARTFQNIRLFQEMTTLENILVGMHRGLRARFWHGALRLPAHRNDERQATFRALEILKFVGLENEASSLASNLAYGDQRRLEIARALATKPKILLLDEPAAGMNPTESKALMELIRRIRELGITVVLIEHDMKVVMGISDRIVVLDYGNKIAEGTPAEIKANPRVIEAYLGAEAHKHE